MKRLTPSFAALFLFFCFPVLIRAQAPTGGPETVKLLTVGNSFADDSMFYFPKIAEANGKKVELFKANLGGCSLERHVRHLTAYEADPKNPEGSPYSSGFYPPNGDPKTRKYSLREALESKKWDYVTIQQFSGDSFKPETFEPYAGTLVAYIRKYAPQAKIVILQTWAYREDYPGYGKDGFSQEKMYEGLKAAYEKLAADYDLQIIPVGHAMQAARATDRWHFTFPDPKFDYKNPPKDTLPEQPGSLNAGWGWRKQAGQTEPTFNLDFKHCNASGRYLAASVFYEALFAADARKTSFVPEKMDSKDAEDLRRLAHEAFASYSGPKVAVQAR
jgi:hypothetical protein